MRILQGLLLSLGVHFLLVWSSQFLPAPVVSNRDRIEFEVVETTVSKNLQNGQVVRDSLLPDQYKATRSEDPLTFLSSESQRVKRQTRAAITGKSQNRALDGGASSAVPEQKPQVGDKTNPDSDIFKLTKNKNIEARAAAAPTTPGYLDLPRGYSTVGESLPNELEVGHFTALNTDRYLYYSFFMRVEDLIRYTWESQVKNSIKNTPRGVFQAQLSDQWISMIEVQLRPNGEFHKAMLLKASGVPGFDYAAIDSFAKAKLFPNPPKDMVEEDGLIHLKYSFTVRYQPRAMVTR